MEQANHETRDGFEVRASRFDVPRDSVNLDPKSKRTITICNLFLNHRLEVTDIVRLLDEDRGNVVSTLLQRGVIKERRQRDALPPKGIERRTYRAETGHRSPIRRTTDK
ncbi:MAG TPA: hypothetical protein VFS12_15490 [Terriglobia bacterium]|nr:hypothetical protein [Terriglobia bacterium]